MFSILILKNVQIFCSLTFLMHVFKHTFFSNINNPYLQHQRKNLRYQHEMNFSEFRNITAGYSSLDDVIKEENFVLWMTKAVTLLTVILSVLGLLSDAVAFRISWGLPEKKSAKSLMQVQAAADCFQCVSYLWGSVWILKGWVKV